MASVIGCILSTGIGSLCCTIQLGTYKKMLPISLTRQNMHICISSTQHHVLCRSRKTTKKRFSLSLLRNKERHTGRHAFSADAEYSSSHHPNRSKPRHYQVISHRVSSSVFSPVTEAEQGLRFNPVDKAYVNDSGVVDTFGSPKFFATSLLVKLPDCQVCE